MAIEVQGLCKSFQGRPVVRQVSFAAGDGELLVLLGPSGSGKSTVLRMVAGLTPADQGRIFVNGNDVTLLRPQARDMGFVFQSYALFEQMTVAENVEFALRVRRCDRASRVRRRDQLLALVGLDGMASRLPTQLSGGQRQRAALARALAHQPSLLLLDEPFGALDARIRQELRGSLRQILKDLRTTAIFVTHDQEEAFALADRILVMHRGRVLEEGQPAQLYAEPRTEFVASFIGRANLLPAGMLRAPGGAIVPDMHTLRARALVRPEDILLAGPQPPAPGCQLIGKGEVVSSEFLGASRRLQLLLEPTAGAPQQRISLQVEQAAALGEAPPGSVGSRHHAYARRVHFVPHLNLRLLLLADADARGRQIGSAALAFGEHCGALLTVLGSLAGDPAMHRRFELHRQQYAGDLRTIDPSAREQDTFDAASHLTRSERFDLAILAIDDPLGQWRKLVAEGGIEALLLPGLSDQDWPFQDELRWELQGTPAERPPALLGELATACSARLHGPDDVQPALRVIALGAPVDARLPALGEMHARWQRGREPALMLLLLPDDGSDRHGDQPILARHPLLVGATPPPFACAVPGGVAL